MTFRSFAVAWLASACLFLGHEAAAQSTSARVGARATAVQPELRRVGLLRVNFQSENAAVPAGFVRDFGEAFGLRGGADQGKGLRFGWVVPGTRDGLDRVGEGRDRNLLVDQRVDTLMHLEHPSGSAPGSWELAVEDGTYAVHVAVGDPLATDSDHVLGVEGVTAFAGFVPSDDEKLAFADVVVNVSDGRLTLDGLAGDNTKLCFVVVRRADGDRPAVAGVNPTQLERGIATDAFVAATLHLPQASLETASVTPLNVQLYPTSNPGAPLEALVNTSGGGDVIVLDPIEPMEPFTRYTFDVGSGVVDLLGNPCLPFRSEFETGPGDDDGGEPLQVDFDSIEVHAGVHFTSVLFGPGGALWALSREGLVYRFDVGLDGGLAGETVFDVLQASEGGPRLAIGLVHDPASTAADPVLWVSHATFGFSNMPDWGGAISRLSGPGLSVVERVVSGLPRSARDHVTNGLAFGPDGALYFLQGSNSAMGAPDTAWANRPERRLSAAVLRLDTRAALALAPVDVQTDEGGTYDPFAAGAPLTVYASGVRNAYDLVWHSNGSLYVPTNGSAAGGNTPATPLPLPVACDERIDGAYTGPSDVPGVAGVNQTQADHLYRVEAAGYYGHPNPARCEWVLNGGNPTAEIDVAEVPGYPVGTQPDPNYRGIAYDFENNKSPNGVVEYRGTAFEGALAGALLVARYSGGDDLIALWPDGPGGDIGSADGGLSAFDGFDNPLDLAERCLTGDLYVSEYGAPALRLLRAVDGDVLGAEVSPRELIFSGVQGTVSAAELAMLVETGSEPLEVESLAFSGDDADAFVLGAGTPSPPWTLAALEAQPLELEFTPPAGRVGPLSATLRIGTSRGEIWLDVYGLSANGLEGSAEPPLAQAVETLGHAIDVGGTGLSLGTHPGAIGDEVLEPLLRRAEPGPVTVRPVARYSPAFPLPFGWYVPNGGAPVLAEVGVLADSSGGPEHQTLFPALAGGGISFDPGDGPFGLYTSSPSHEAFTQDALNELLFPGNVGHAARIYPLKDRDGAPIANAFLVGFEEASNGDYQDYVFVIENVVPAD